jgi:hypothetical protein
MTTFLSFHAFAAARGEGLHPELRLLFERAATSPVSDVVIRHDGLLQSGPDPAAEIVPERVNVSPFPQARVRQTDELNQNPETPAQPLLPRGDDTMRYIIVLLLVLSGMTAGNAGTLMERLRLAQNRTFAECVSNCNSNNFSCAQNCGLSGTCVAQCTAASAACQNGCNRLK